ncbi:hypothetical protein BD560DRAFT_420973 [Blakeslea trispora]|nr:hypothetical protein BD560DRAFT_420973 [Blakeslea trispora]
MPGLLLSMFTIALFSFQKITKEIFTVLNSHYLRLSVIFKDLHDEYQSIYLGQSIICLAVQGTMNSKCQATAIFLFSFIRARRSIARYFSDIIFPKDVCGSFSQFGRSTAVLI